MSNEMSKKNDPPGGTQSIKFGSEMIGYQLNGCEIVDFIGKGGMGAVYKAIQMNLNREVALKILSTPNKDEKAIEWFQREAQSIAQLEHKNIIQVYSLDYSDTLGTFYIVMQFVDGASLDRLVKNATNGRLLVEKALFYCIQVAEGLGAAHQKGIIHRDVKPANLMVTNDNVVKITDFGLAKSLTMTTTSSASAGLIVGTPLYMAPEQCVGTQIDARTDIYSLGATLYYLLAGRPPFIGENSYDILEKQITEAPPLLTEFAPDIPIELSNVVLKMLAKNRDERHENCEEVVKELQKFVQKQHNTGSYTQDLYSEEKGVYRLTGVNKQQFAEDFHNAINEGRKGILSIRSKDEHLFLYITENTIYAYIENHMEDFLEKHSQLSFLEMITMLLTISYSWDPFTWEFVQEEPPEEFQEYCIHVKVDVFSFLKNALNALHILLDLSKEGSLIVRTPIQSALFSFTKEFLHVFSPAPFQNQDSQTLEEERIASVLEKIMQSNYSLEYHQVLSETPQQNGFENSLVDIFFQILQGFPDFNFFQTFSLYNDSIYPQLEQKITLAKVKELDNKIGRILQQIFLEYKKLEEAGLPKSYSIFFVGAIVKERAFSAATKTGEMALAMFSDNENTIAKHLFELSSKLYRYNFKLLEEIYSFHENSNHKSKALEIWLRCGSLREELGEFEQAKSSYEYAHALDENDAQALMRLFYLYINHNKPIDKIIIIGEKLLSKLRKTDEKKKMIEVCNKLLLFDPELLVCHQELVNNYLDQGNSQQAVEAYQKITEIYIRQENKPAAIQIYQKILKIFPDRQDIREKMMSLEGKPMKLIKTLDTATKVLKRNNKVLNPKYFVITTILFIILLISYREANAYWRFQKVQQQIQRGNYLQVKEELEQFMKSSYFLNMSYDAAALYSQEESKIRNQNIQNEKQNLADRIATMEVEYKDNYETILKNLNNLYDEYYQRTDLKARLELENIIKDKINSITEKYRVQNEKKDEEAFASISTLMEKRDFRKAYKILNELLEKDFVTWNQKAIELKKVIAREERKWENEILVYQEQQQEMINEARSFEDKGDIEHAISIYRDVEKLVPGSLEATRAKAALDSLEKLLRDGEEWLKEAEKLMLQGEYQEGVRYLERIASNIKLSGSRKIKNAEWPILITTTPVNGIECFYGAKKIGVSPCVYKAKNFIEDKEWQIKNIGLKKVKVQKEYTRNNKKLYHINIDLERIPLWTFQTKGRIESPLLLQRETILCASTDNNVYGVTKGGEKLWDIYTGRLSEITGSMQISDNQLFVSTLSGSLYVINLNHDFLVSKNAVLWNDKIANTGFPGGPYVEGDNVFLAGDNGQLFYLKKTGQSLKILQRYSIKDNIKSAPLIFKNQFIVGGKSRIYALNTDLRKGLWQSNKYKISADFVAEHQKIFIPTQKGLVAIYPGGREAWNIDIKKGIKSTPVVQDGIVFVAGVDGDVFALDTNDGKEVWKVKVISKFNVPLLKYKDVIFACGEYEIWGFSMKNGSIVLKYNATKEDLIYSKPACDGEYLYYSSGRSIFKIWIKDIFAK